MRSQAFTNRLLLALLVPLLFAPVALAAPGEVAPAGTLTVVEGQVRVQRGKAEHVVTPQGGAFQVYPHDALLTLRASRAELTLQSGTESITLYPATQLIVREATDEGARIEFPQGKALFKVLRNLRRIKYFAIDTPLVIMGIKGTEFIVGSEGRTSAFLLTLTGVVSLRSKEFPDEEILVGEREFSLVMEGQRASSPIRIDSERSGNILRDQGLETLERLGEEINRERLDRPGIDKERPDSNHSRSEELLPQENELANEDMDNSEHEGEAEDNNNSDRH